VSSVACGTDSNCIIQTGEREEKRSLYSYKLKCYCMEMRVGILYSSRLSSSLALDGVSGQFLTMVSLFLGKEP
jgi:hypothetical protein